MLGSETSGHGAGTRKEKQPECAAEQEDDTAAKGTTEGVQRAAHWRVVHSCDARNARTAGEAERRDLQVQRQRHGRCSPVRARSAVDVRPSLFLLSMVFVIHRVWPLSILVPCATAPLLLLWLPLVIHLSGPYGWGTCSLACWLNTLKWLL